jgi:hypothetical protein
VVGDLNDARTGEVVLEKSKMTASLSETKSQLLARTKRMRNQRVCAPYIYTDTKGFMRVRHSAMRSMD